MKILSTKNLEIPGVEIIRFARFIDVRGYTTGPYKKTDIAKHFGQDMEIMQTLQSLSKKNTIRGMHFQWNPILGKFVRTITGRMVDMILDIRKNSPTYGKMLLYNMPENKRDYDEWIWVPPGLVHGNFFTQNTVIEYMYTGEYNPNCEASISPLAGDIDWSICNKELKQEFDEITKNPVISEKDKKGLTLKQWEEKPESELFFFH